MSIKPWPYNNNRETSAPYAKGSDTSKMAAESQSGKVQRDIQRIYDLLIAEGKRGLTTDEIRIKSGMLASTAGARRRDLELIGGCRKIKLRRRTAAGSLAYVYVAIEGVDITKPKRVGRPKKQNKNDVKVTIYMTPDLHSALNDAASAAGVSASVYVRNVLQGELQDRRREAELKRQMELGMRMSAALDILGGE